VIEGPTSNAESADLVQDGRADRAANGNPSAAGFAPLPVGAICPDCGYDLRGSTSARCPECGFALAPFRLSSAPLLPWTMRRQIGWIRAYWRTVWLMFRYPQRVCMETARPVSYADAQWFRWITTVIVLATCVVATPLVAEIARQRGAEIGPWTLACVYATLLSLVIFTPGMVSYAFQRRGMSIERQNRAIALSYYLMGPLTLTPLALALLLLARFLSETDAQGLQVASGLLAIALLAMVEEQFIRFQRALVGRTLLAALGWSALLLLGRLILCLVGLVGVLAVFFVLVVIDSLR
jgi:hypothetical protein